MVVPLVGTWIETPSKGVERKKVLVVPLVGTWIETYKEGLGEVLN